MQRSRLLFVAMVVCSNICSGNVRAQTTTPVGIFENHADVGTVLHAGSADYDATNKTYTISGSGENMWSTADAFQFAWKKMSASPQTSAS